MQLGVSRNTVTAAYGRLVAEGYITGRGAAGSFVAYADPASRSATRPSALTAANAGLGDASRWSLGGFDTTEPRFDLRTGRPDPALFPLVEWRRAMGAALSTPPSGYGHPAGLSSLRSAIARWVGRSRGVDADPDHVVITAGAQQGLDLIARLLVRPGASVVIEDPGYPPAINLFRSLGATVTPARVDLDGIVIDDIPADATLVYVTPSHQAPTGVVMSMERRRHLLELAATHDIAIVEDDYDTEYRHRDRPLEPLQRLDRSGRVIYVGTFSKVLSPSLRLGFVVLPPSLVDDAITLRSLMDWQPPAASQQALHRFIVDGHLDRHLRRTRRIYAQRCELVCDRLDVMARRGVLSEVLPSAAGLHITVHLSDGLDEQSVRAAAARRGVALGDYAGCWQRAPRTEGLMIGFGAVPSDSLPSALDALTDALTATLDGRTTAAPSTRRGGSGPAGTQGHGVA